MNYPLNAYVYKTKQMKEISVRMQGHSKAVRFPLKVSFHDFMHDLELALRERTPEFLDEICGIQPLKVCVSFC
jgi:hypothetical protein